jgi:hypothetical protein
MLRNVPVTLAGAAIVLMAQGAFAQNVATQVDISGEWAARP